MNKKTAQKLISFIIFSGILISSYFLWTTCVCAFTPNKEEQLVYGITAFDGEDYLGRYRDIFCPQSEQKVFVIANSLNVVTLAYSLVYFWPDENKYLIDRISLNEEIDGYLEIAQAGAVISRIEAQPFAYYLPRGQLAQETVLLVGAEAKDKYATFLQDKVKQEKLVQDYQRALEEHEKKKQEMQTKILRGEIPAETLPPEPQPPEELLRGLYEVTPLQSGYPFSVLPGTYTMHLVDEAGRIIEKSTKTLVAIEPRRRSGIGYDIIPEYRYVRREYTSDPSEQIYVSDQNYFFLRAFHQEEYQEFGYEKVKDPQNVGRQEKWIWARTGFQPRSNLRLKMYVDGKEYLEVDERAYFLRTVPGSTYSYEVLEYKEGEMPYSHFSGFKIPVNIAGTASLTLRAFELNEQGETENIFGRRTVVRVSEVADNNYFLPFIFPIFAGVIGFTWKLVRRRRFT